MRAPTGTLQVEEVEAEVLLGHSVVIQQIKEGGSDTDWRARITSPKADIECPKTGRKTLYAAGEDGLKTNVRKWLDDCQDDEQ